MDENNIIKVSVAPEVKEALVDEFVDEYEKYVDDAPETVINFMDQIKEMPEEMLDSLFDGMIRVIRKLETLARVSGYDRLSDFAETAFKTSPEEFSKILFDDEDDFDD